MKKFLKILKIIMWILLVGGAGTLVGFVEAAQYSRSCTKTVISIDYGSADVLITKKDVDSIVLKCAGMLTGKPLGFINLASIENTILAQPYVNKVHVYESNEGALFIDIRQREPILRIINKNFENFYLDGSGTLLPVNPGFSARVLVANGFISSSYIKSPKYRINVMSLADSVNYNSPLTDLYRLTMYITHDKFLKAQIDQIYVNAQGEFELIPRVGNHVILLGDANDLGEKFSKLYAFYKYGLNKIGWNKYNTINIKFKNQVLCSNQ